jgi:viroplasmin and RNaseH domain-containing protein
MAIRKKKYYAYFVPDGAQGVTDDWMKCERVVKGKTGARYKAFDNKAGAEQWLAGGAVYEAKQAPKLERGVYFDAGTGRGRGVEVSVTDEKGNNLLHRAISKGELNKFGKHFLDDLTATNNYGELLALRYALMIAKKLKIKKIFGDSRLVIDYWSKWRMKRKALPEETVALANKVAKMREAFEKRGGTVLQISGAYNPADLGFHK